MGMDEFMVKICGITNFDDALASVGYGANALGFNFYRPSTRYVDPQTVENILQDIPENILNVAVVVVSSSNVSQTIKDISHIVPSIDAFQLHGLKSESEVPSTDKLLYIATSPAESKAFANYRILIDTSWGRGQKANWDQLLYLKRAFVLSGGLDPDNVTDAIQLLQPDGVDVCSGVEKLPGVKDGKKLRKFIEGARHASQA